MGIIGTDRIPASTQTKSDQPKAPDVQTITAEELKVKLAKKDPVTILDVRASDSYVSSENKIEGAIFVRFRRLRSRLAQPPLKDVPRDREIVTYCACPNEETSIRAAHVLLAKCYFLLGKTSEAEAEQRWIESNPAFPNKGAR